MPRCFHIIRKNSFSTTMVLVAALVALVSWWSLDLYYQHSVQELVAAGWQEHPKSETGDQTLSLLREQRTLLILAFVFLYCTFFACLGRRLRKIHGALDQYSNRLGIQLPRASDGDELRRLGKRLERMSEEVIAETSALEYQARHDNLTNLPNRALLMARLEAGLAEALEQDESMSLFILDLDRFKEVNDTLGHHIGDRMLQEVGRRLVSVLRRTDMVARLGGDEFAVLLPGADVQRSKAICRKIFAALDQPIKEKPFCLRFASYMATSAWRISRFASRPCCGHRATPILTAARKRRFSTLMG